MRNKKVLTGYWWVPDGDPVGGKAVFDPESGIKLELFEMISEGPWSEEKTSFDRIFGNTTDGDQVTLVDCFNAGSSISMGSGSLSTESYRAQTLIMGGHLPESETLFDRFRVIYPLLYQWAGRTGLARHLSGNDEGGIDEVDITYTPPSKKKAEIESGSVNIITSANMSYSVRGEYSITEETYLEVSSNKRDKKVEGILEEVHQWQDFLTLATDKNIGVQEVLAYKEGEGLKGTPKEFQIFYEPSNEFEYPERISPKTAAFMLEDIDEQFPEIIKNWIELSNNYSTVYDLYFSVVYQSNMYLDNQYMMLMSALNLFYQKRFNYKYVNDNELEQVTQNLIKAVPQDIDEEFKTYLIEDVLPSANQHSLRKRLTRIADEYRSVLKSLPWNFAEEIDDLIQFHNYSMGRSPELQQAEPQWLHQKTLVLSAMLETIILMDLGIPEDSVKESISEKYEIPNYY